MSDCDSNACPSTKGNNCSQKLASVKLDPSTKLGASCALAGRPTLYDEYPCFEVTLFAPSE